MKLGTIFQSIDAWKKLSAINMRPKLAYAVLKYTRLVSAEYEIVEKQRVALIHEITGTKEGEEAKIAANSPEIAKYVEKFNAIMVTASDLKPLDVNFEEVVNAVDSKDEVLSVSDLALLEPFFSDYAEPEDEFRNEDGTPKTELKDCCNAGQCQDCSKGG